MPETRAAYRDARGRTYGFCRPCYRAGIGADCEHDTDPNLPDVARATYGELELAYLTADMCRPAGRTSPDVDDFDAMIYATCLPLLEGR